MMLPKIWMGRIAKYWDKIMPTDYPSSESVFSLTFEKEEDKAAVTDMESKLGTDESIIPEMLPENTYVSEYVGTYDVTTEEEVPETGLYTLLSPEKIKGAVDVMALHFNGTEWEKVEDATIVDGYVYGTLKSFSPVAIFTYKKDIHKEAKPAGVAGSWTDFIVCEGNPVQVTEEDGVVICKNPATGKSFELDTNYAVVGGTIDGTSIESTSVSINGLSGAKKIKIFAGSIFMEPEKNITLGSISVDCIDTKIYGITGSYGAVRTNKVVMNIKNSKLNWTGNGEGYAKLNTPPTSFASTAWVKNSKMNIENSEIELLYPASNCEYFYTDLAELNVDGGKYDYLITGASNDGVNKCISTIKNATVGIFQTVNRGNVAESKTVFENCEVENLFIGGDATDKTVTGTTGLIKIDINKGGRYSIVNGTENGVALTKEDIDRIVDTVKITRSAEITIDTELKSMLGNKYITK